MLDLFKFFKRKPPEPHKSTADFIASVIPPKSKQEYVSETPFKRPSKGQIEECARLGLEIKDGMSSREVWQMINEAKKDPVIKAKDDAYIAEQNAKYEAYEREEYGDAIVDELNKWKSLCSVRGHHLVVFKKGKTVDADIIEIERASIEDADRVFIKIEGYRPKVYKPRGESPYIEWNKEVSFKSQQILEVTTLQKPIDMFAIADYEEAMVEANKLIENYQQTSANKSQERTE